MLDHAVARGGDHVFHLHRLENDKRLPGFDLVADNLAVTPACDSLVLAVKPQVLRSVCRELEEAVAAILSAQAGQMQDQEPESPEKHDAQ